MGCPGRLAVGDSMVYDRGHGSFKVDLLGQPKGRAVSLTGPIKDDWCLLGSGVAMLGAYPLRLGSLEVHEFLAAWTKRGRDYCTQAIRRRMSGVFEALP